MTKQVKTTERDREREREGEKTKRKRKSTQQGTRATEKVKIEDESKKKRDWRNVDCASEKMTGGRKRWSVELSPSGFRGPSLQFSWP